MNRKKLTHTLAHKQHTTLVCDSDFQPKVLRSADRSLHVGRIGFCSFVRSFFHSLCESERLTHAHTRTQNRRRERERKKHSEIGVSSSSRSSNDESWARFFHLFSRSLSLACRTCDVGSNRPLSRYAHRETHTPSLSRSLYDVRVYLYLQPRQLHDSSHE